MTSDRFRGHRTVRRLVAVSVAVWICAALLAVAASPAHADGMCNANDRPRSGVSLTLIGKTYHDAEAEIRTFYAERYPESDMPVIMWPDLPNSYPSVDPSQIRVRDWACYEAEPSDETPYHAVAFLIEASTPDVRGMTASEAEASLAQRGLTLAVSDPDADQDWVVSTQDVEPESVLVWNDGRTDIEPTVTVILAQPVTVPDMVTQGPEQKPADPTTPPVRRTTTPNTTAHQASPSPTVRPPSTAPTFPAAAVHPTAGAPAPPDQQHPRLTAEYGGLFGRSVLLPIIVLACLGLAGLLARLSALVRRRRRRSAAGRAPSPQRPTLPTPTMPDIRRYSPKPQTWLELDANRPARTVSLVARADPGTPTLRGELS